MQAVPIDPHVVERRRLFTAALMPALCVVALWIAFAFDRVYHLDLARFGILPRTLRGLIGIVVSPFVHADLDHLLNNSIPIFVLGWMLVYFYPKVAARVVWVSWLVGGLWVWATARENYHIGASGVVYGLAAFLFVSGVIRKQRGLMTVSLIIVFLYGSMWWGMLPLLERISYESHFFGALSGVVMAYVYRKVPPAHVTPPIEFPEEEDDLLDPAEGQAQEGDEVDEAEQAWRQRMAQEAAHTESPDPFGPAYRSSFTSSGQVGWRYQQSEPPAEGADERGAS